MSREVRRVPLDFDWPLKTVWEGYLSPDRFDEIKCLDCHESGYSPFAYNLYQRWYGNAPFHPTETGSTPFGPETPPIRAMAEHHTQNESWYYGSGELATLRECVRLAKHFNNGWLHHLAQEDVDALIEAGRLMDFTHTWTKEDRWQPIEPPPVVTAEQVNLWSLRGMGHDSINCWVAIKARCERAGEPTSCSLCDGHGSTEAYEGQRAEAEAWKRTEPPTGEGYQLWETVSEGSPVSPVFHTAEGLASWIKTHGNKFDGRDTSHEALVKWVEEEGSSAGSMITGPEIGMVSGVQFAAEHAREDS